MSHNKIIGYFCFITIGLGLLLVPIINAWEDHPDIGFIDHLLDFHLDYDHVLEDFHRDMEEKADRERRCAEWAQDIRDGYRDNDWGTCTGIPDRD